MKKRVIPLLNYTMKLCKNYKHHLISLSLSKQAWSLSDNSFIPHFIAIQDFTASETNHPSMWRRGGRFLKQTTWYLSSELVPLSVFSPLGGRVDTVEIRQLNNPNPQKGVGSRMPKSALLIAKKPELLSLLQYRFFQHA